MTLLETERLARKLTAAVDNPPESSAALKLAEDFAAACRTANVRLRQCEAMLDSGDIPQALQLAETAPNLLDLITRLEFRNSDAWRAYCHANRLPAAESLDDRAVHRLNDAYTNGSSNQDPLYRRYRKAVLTKNDDEARTVLRSIARLNPDDANASEELARLDNKVLAEKLTVLNRAVDTSTPAQVATLSEAIESGGFHTPPSGEQWRRAQQVRVLYLLQKAEMARSAEDWRTTLSQLELIQHLQSECEFDLAPEEHSRFAPLKQWADAGLKRHLQDNEFAQHVSQLTRLLGANEEKDTMARAVPTAEMKSDFEGMHRVWRAMQDLARPVPDELNNRFRKRSALLTTEISRRTRRRVQAIAAISAAVLLISGLAVWLALTQFRARDFAAQLASAEESRQLQTAEKLIARVKTEEQRLLGVGALNAAIAKAESFVSRERELLKTFETAFSALPENPARGLSAAQILSIQRQFDDAKSLFDKISPDIRAEQQPRFAALQNKWEKLLASESVTVNSDYDTNLRQLEQDASRLDYNAEVEITRSNLEPLAALLMQLHETEKTFTTNVTVRADLRQRREVAEVRLRAFERQIGDYDEALQALQRARAFADYAGAIEKLSHSEFSSSPLVIAARSRRVSELNDETLLQALLCPGNNTLAAYLKAQSEDKFVPAAAMPAEVKLAGEIQSAINVAAQIRRYRVVLRSPENKKLEWLTVGPMKQEAAWSSIHVYEPAAYPSAFVAVPTQYGFFDGRYRISEHGITESVQDLGSVRETACASTLSLGTPPIGGVWRSPLLRTLDQINAATDCSPLFRAFVFLKTVDVMELQPEAWGLAFCPAARSHRDQLKAIVGDLKEGDWFAPEPSSRLAGPLEEFFSAARRTSYPLQAQALASLARKTWESGLKVAGYVDITGQPQLTGDVKPGELWGFDAEKSPGLLFRTEQGNFVATRTPLALSPLFALPQARSALLAAAGVKPQDELFAGHLPPLFADLAKKK